MMKALKPAVLGTSVGLFSWFGLAWGAQDAIVLYPAYGSGDSSALEGRVIEQRQAATPTSTDRKRDNVRRNLGLLVNEERARYQVSVHVAEKEQAATTDEEGYFRIELDALAEVSPGWHRVVGRAGESTAETGLLLVPPHNTHGLISDLDDTILITEVNNTRRMLANTLFGNPLQRQAVPGTARLYRELADRNADPAAAPTFYLSASPRQLHGPIQAFLDHGGFPRGVLITKRVTNDATSDPLLDQMAYKTTRIEAIFAGVPHARFILIGDDGEHDPEIYQQIRARYPDRVEAIWIRRVHPDPRRARLAGQGDLRELLGAD